MLEFIREFTYEEAENMLPLVQTYSRDLKALWQEAFILTKKKEILEKGNKKTDHIDLQILSLKRKLRRWTKELGDISCEICSVKYGYIDIPIVCWRKQELISICVSEKSIPGKLYFHKYNESNNDGFLFRKPYLFGMKK